MTVLNQQHFGTKGEGANDDLGLQFDDLTDGLIAEHLAREALGYTNDDPTYEQHERSRREFVALRAAARGWKPVSTEWTPLRQDEPTEKQEVEDYTPYEATLVARAEKARVQGSRQHTLSARHEHEGKLYASLIASAHALAQEVIPWCPNYDMFAKELRWNGFSEKFVNERGASIFAQYREQVGNLLIESEILSGRLKDWSTLDPDPAAHHRYHSAHITEKGKKGPGGILLDSSSYGVKAARTGEGPNASSQKAYGSIPTKGTGYRVSPQAEATALLQAQESSRITMRDVLGI